MNLFSRFPFDRPRRESVEASVSASSPDPGGERLRRAAACRSTSALQWRGCHLSFFIARSRSLSPSSLPVSFFLFFFNSSSFFSPSSPFSRTAVSHSLLKGWAFSRRTAPVSPFRWADRKPPPPCPLGCVAGCGLQYRDPPLDNRQDSIPVNHRAPLKGRDTGTGSRERL